MNQSFLEHDIQLIFEFLTGQNCVFSLNIKEMLKNRLEIYLLTFCDFRLKNSNFIIE